MNEDNVKWVSGIVCHEICVSEFHLELRIHVQIQFPIKKTQLFCIDFFSISAILSSVLT